MESIELLRHELKLLCPRPSSKSNQTFILLFENGKNDCLIDCCAVGRPLRNLRMEVGLVFSFFGGLWPLPAAGAPPKREDKHNKPTGMNQWSKGKEQLHCFLSFQSNKTIQWNWLLFDERGRKQLEKNWLGRSLLDGSRGASGADRLMAGAVALLPQQRETSQAQLTSFFNYWFIDECSWN